jgi:beta-lactamase regulating signal transducer with metallopeptidase domain/biopolymer transport protein ExbD
MMNFLLYDAKVAVALLVFYLFYRFLLKKETFHRFNRVVLVGTAVLSFLLPLCIITIHKPVEMAAPLVTESAMVAELPGQELAPLVQASEPWWPVVLTILFWTGVACVLARVLVSILSILRIIRQAEPVREEDGCRILVTERNIDPFSWMKYIVLSRKDWELPHESILTHEKAHIAYGHSIEILLVDVLSALQWFNPAIWMLRADLKELHEYEADDAVLRAGANLREYQYLLIRKAVSKSGYSVANSFNHSILKNRITMMSKSKSPLARGLRALYLLPLVCLAIGLQARTVYVPVDKDSEKNVSDETNSLSGTVWTGDVGKLTFSDTAFEIRMEEALISGHYTSEGSTIRFIFTNYKSLKTGKEKKGEDQLTGTRKGDAITLPVPNGKMVFSRVNQRAVQKAESIVLNIRKDGTIESGGKVYTPAQLKDLIAPHQAGQPQTTVTIMAPDDAPMGVIDDVKNELRKLESLKINYASASSREGVTRYMPPYPSAPTAKKPNYPEETFPGVKRENIFVVRINANDKIFFGDRPRQDDQEMLQAGKDFLRKRGKDARFSLQADRGTSYGAYQHMQSLLWQVYEEVRNEKALEVYGKRLPDLSADERSQINFLVPLSISEAEMKGKK